MITTSIKDQPIGVGLIFSIILHVTLVLLVILGLPIFWQPEPLPEAIGIQMATLSDITAAPKAPIKAPKVTKGADQVTSEQKQPPKPTPAPPPPNEKAASVPPPPTPAPPQPQPTPAAPPKVEQAEAIPDKTKKPEEKKPEEKKPEEQKPEQKKVDQKPDDKPKKKDTSDQDLKSLLNNVLKDAPAPDTKADKTKKAAPPPAQQASAAPEASQFSELPLTASETDGIAAQVRGNWNIGSLAGAPDFDKMVVTIHVSLQPDGTITDVKVDNDQPGNPYFRQAMESARRALLITRQLKLPPGKTYATITFRFRPADFQ